jgi:ribosomal protein L21
MATEVVEVAEVATESEEDVVINCVAIFYEEGKEGENFRKKNKFRCEVNKNEKRVLTIVFSTEREHFTRQEGHNSRRDIYSAFHN